jgi:hypothetical protein
LYNTYDSDTNELQSANNEDSDEDVANMPSEGHDEVMNYLLEDSFCMHEVLPARYQEQIKKLHPVKEELLIIMRKNHMSIKLFKKLMAWAKRARTSKYDFNYPTYHTVLDRMKKKYFFSRLAVLRCAAQSSLVIPSHPCMSIGLGPTPNQASTTKPTLP